ncbi:hypothetical protein ACNKHO_26320 [Shigella flexneri]
MINQRLYIVYVRLATNLLQITEFTIKRSGKEQSIPAEPALELGLDTSRPIMYVCLITQGRLTYASRPMSGA